MGDFLIAVPLDVHHAVPVDGGHLHRLGVVVHMDDHDGVGAGAAAQIGGAGVHAEDDEVLAAASFGHQVLLFFAFFLLGLCLCFLFCGKGGGGALLGALAAVKELAGHHDADHRQDDN